jgi:uncharacterized protein
MVVRQIAGAGLVFLMAVSVAGAQTVADAAMRGDAGLVSELLAQGRDANESQADGATALHWAVYRSDLGLATQLIEAGADVSAANRDGSTPLWLAAINGDAAMIGALIDGGADPNEALPLGRTPLMVAARTGKVDAVQALLDAGADVSVRDSEQGTTPLMWAADQGHAGVIRLLVENGADVAERSDPAERGRGPALGKSNDPRSAVRRQVEAILAGEESQLFFGDDDAADAAAAPPLGLANGQAAAGGGRGGRGGRGGGNAAANAGGADAAGNAQAAGGGGGRGRGGQNEPDGGRLTALVYAARAGHLEAARALIQAGADVNQITGYGWSPLLAATQNRNYQLGAYLLENGADVNLANEGGWTPLYLATDNRNIEGGDYPVREADMDHLEYIRLLLDAGADVNARMIDSTETRTVFTNQWLDERGATAFLRASQSGDIDLMRLLLEYGADPHIYTELNVTPLAVAAGIGWVEGIQSEWSTEQTVEAVRLLLELGIDPNIQADTGRTALHGAAHKGATEVARILVEAGARMDIRDYGNTDNRGSPELAAHTWLPVDYADGLVRVGVQSAIPHPETGALLRQLMEDAGLETPPAGRTLDSICIVEVCSLDEYQ